MGANEQLKPCPFCGGETILKVNHGFVSAFVYCEECGVNTRSYTLERTANEAWNRRVEQ